MYGVGDALVFNASTGIFLPPLPLAGVALAFKSGGTRVPLTETRTPRTPRIIAMWFFSPFERPAWLRPAWLHRWINDLTPGVNGLAAQLAQRFRDCLRHEPLPTRPLVIVAAALAAGCVAGPAIPVGAVAAVWACWLAAAACVGGWAVFIRRHHPRPAAVVLIGAVLLAGAAWSRTRLELFDGDDIAWQLGPTPVPLGIRGTVVESPRKLLPPAGDDRRAAAIGPSSGCVVAVTAVRTGSRWRPAAGRASVIVAAEPRELPVGTRVRILGRGLRPAGPLNPDEADATARARAARCLSIVRVSAWGQVRVTAGPPWWSPTAAVDRLQTRAVAILDEQVSPTRAALAAALLLGQRNALPRATADEFVITGTIHVLAISGLHVGLLAAGLFTICRWACVSRRWAGVAVAVVTGGYMLLVGGGTPVVRATILVWVACGAVAAGRRPATVNSLALAALVILLWRPAEVLSSGAHLSFLSTGILVGVAHMLRRPPELDPIDRLIERSRPRWEKVARRAVGWTGAAAAASVAVWLATAPLVAHRFHMVSLVGLAVNVPVAALVPVAMACGFLCLLTAPFSATVAGVFAGGCDLALAAITTIVSLAADLPGGHAWVAGPPSWWVAGWYVSLAATLIWLRRDLLCRVATWATLAVVWSVVGIVGSWSSPHPAAPGLRVVMTAVGHGCGIVVRSPSGRCLLYDAGRLGAAAAAVRSLSAVLWSERITAIDTLMVSHADADHFNAVPDLLARFRVGEIVVPAAFLASPSVSAIAVLAAAADRGIPVRTASAGDAFAIDPLCRVRVLRPLPAADAEGQPAASDNDTSLVVAIEAAGRRVLFTGDLEGRSLGEFVAAGPGECDVLVAPHHGSRTSLPADIARVTVPAYVLASGRGGRGWPEVEAAYATAAGQTPATVLLTGGDGAVAVTLAAGGITAERFTEGRWRPLPARDQVVAERVVAGRVGQVNKAPATISTSWLTTYVANNSNTPLVNP